MDTQTDVNLPRPQMTLRNVNSGNVFYTPLTSFAGKKNLSNSFVYLWLIATGEGHCLNDLDQGPIDLIGD